MMNETMTTEITGYYQSVMQPIPGEHPCGESLEYDPAFIMLLGKLQPKLGAEYGTFFEAAEPVNWSEVERECLSLLQKSKDVRLIIILMRCRIRQKGLVALSEGLEALRELLRRWPDDLHPQTMDEGEFEPFMRANAFAELEDTNGLLADLRNQPLPKAAGLQISIKDFEKAHVIPREEGALADTTVAALIHDWHTNAAQEIAVLTRARRYLLDIKKILDESLAFEAPLLGLIDGILRLFSNEFADTSEAEEAAVLAEQTYTDDADYAEPVEDTEAPEAEHGDDDVAEEAAAAPSIPRPAKQQARRGIENRTDALRRLQEVRSWFAMTEPSSPVVLMLKYAEESIGKNFADLLKMYPPEIITMLDGEKSEKE